MPSVYRTVLGRMAIEPITELESILITGSGVLVDDSTMLLRLVPGGGVIRERMLLAENQQLNWATSDGFVTVRWPSESGCVRRAIFVAPHEVVLSPVSSLERALEVAHTHRAHSPEGDLVEPYLDFAEGELGRIWTDDMPSRVTIGGLHPTGGDLLVREIGLDATEIRLELRWYDASEAERGEAELERLFGMGSSTALLSGIANLLSLFHVTRDGQVTVASGTLTDAELVDALGMARAAAAIFL